MTLTTPIGICIGRCWGLPAMGCSCMNLASSLWGKLAEMTKMTGFKIFYGVFIYSIYLFVYLVFTAPISLSSASLHSFNIPGAGLALEQILYKIRFWPAALDGLPHWSGVVSQPLQP